MRILITGRDGQVGHELGRVAWPAASTVHLLGRTDGDLTDAASLRRILAALRPDLVINAAAYTAVDRAETEPEQAFAVNRDGPAALAAACHAQGAALIHLSTDYVFDGTRPTPYREDDKVAPLGVYGASKEAGETAVRTEVPRHVILRTSWVFGAHGTNFVKTMLRLAATRPELRVVADQHGCPTPAADIASAVATIAAAIGAGRGVWGTFHFCGAGPTTWHGFARAIVDRARPGPDGRPRVLPIATAEYPTPARRPVNSVLDCTRIGQAYGVVPPSWHGGLEEMLAALGALE